MDKFQIQAMLDIYNITANTPYGYNKLERDLELMVLTFDMTEKERRHIMQARIRAKQINDQLRSSGK